MKCYSVVLSTLFAITLLLISGSASATSTTYTVVGGGLDDGLACLSGPPTCAETGVPTFLFGPSDSFPISGSFTFDDVTNTVDIDLTLASATMFGGHDGVSEVIFTNVNYVVTGMTAFVFGIPPQLQGFAKTGTVTGTYAQSDGTSTVVGPDLFSEPLTFFSAFGCLNLDTIGTCGLTVGASRDFALAVGVTGLGDSTDFVHTFNFQVAIPEPTTASLLALGLVAMAAARRSHR